MAVAFFSATTSIAPVSCVRECKDRYFLLKKCSSSSSSITGRVWLIEFNPSKSNLGSLRNCEVVAGALSNNHTINDVSLDWEDQGQDGEIDMSSPWEGAIVYRRNGSVSHVEYCTTLERLGLGKLSTDVSKSKASIMGLRVTKAVKDYPHGTPVQVSLDVTRKKQRLRLDGIVKTVITLGCNRCGEPAAESVFSNFSLLLSEEPIEEPEIIEIGVTLDRGKTSYNDEEDDDDGSIDWDDRLHFPAEQKEIDISKNIRDLVHLEITLNAICDTKCKGLCLKCGSNLNKGSCDCSEENAQENYGPLKDLRQRMQAKC